VVRPLRTDTYRPEICDQGHKGRIRLHGPRAWSPAHQKLRYRCMHGNTHTFSLAMAPRQPTHSNPKSGQKCAHCQRTYRTGEGPLCGHAFMFTIQESAFALVETGKGESNRATAQKVRKAALRPKQKPRLLQRQRGPGGKPMVPRRRTAQAWSRESNIVADYIDLFAPTVLADLRAEGDLPTQWPRGLAVDSTSLRRKKLVNGKRRSGGEDAGEIFVAMGTDVANGEAKPVALAFMGGKTPNVEGGTSGSHSARFVGPASSRHIPCEGKGSAGCSCRVTLNRLSFEEWLGSVLIPTTARRSKPLLKKRRLGQ
jgi:hypothetical protein